MSPTEDNIDDIINHINAYDFDPIALSVKKYGTDPNYTPDHDDGSDKSAKVHYIEMIIEPILTQPDNDILKHMDTLKHAITIYYENYLMIYHIPSLQECRDYFKSMLNLDGPSIIYNLRECFGINTDHS